MSRLDDIKAREAAATEGPWEWRPESSDEWPIGDQNLYQAPWAAETSKPVVTSWGYDADGIEASDADRAFIANAREDIPWLVERIEAALALHGPYTPDDLPFHHAHLAPFCRECSRSSAVFVSHPCPTVRALGVES